MRKNLILLFAGAVLAVCSLVAASTVGSAATSTVNLSITGGTVAGYTRSFSGARLPVVFTVKNNSTTTTASNLNIRFTLTHATADLSDYTCPLTSNHANINADTPSCEPGALAHGKSTSAAIMAVPGSGTTVTVKACVTFDGIDPSPSNNCKTVSIPIQ